MTDGHPTQGKILRGVAVSPGIIIGKARVVDRSRVKILYQYLINDDHISREVARFKEAQRITENQLISLKKRIPDKGKEHAFIFDSCLMMLKDSMLNDSTIQKILKENLFNRRERGINVFQDLLVHDVMQLLGEVKETQIID